MKNKTAALLAFCAGLSFLRAQTVTTITTAASKIDDDFLFDAAGNLYGSNYVGATVYKRAADGTESVFVNGIGSPNGLALRADSTIILADNTGNKLYRLFPNGSKEVFVEPFSGPSGILPLPGTDTLLVTSYTTHRVWKVAPDGSVADFLTHPQFNGPTGLCYDDSMNLYVANFNDRKIFKVTPDGEVSFFTQPPQGQNIGFIAYAKGNIYATAMNAHKIYKIDLNGNYLVWLGSAAGNADGDASVARFNRPNGIRASASGDTLYVSDFGSKRVRRITNLNGSTGAHTAVTPEWKLAVSPNPLVAEAAVTFDLPDAATLSLGLYDERGRRVRQLFDNRRLEPGPYRFALNGQGLPAGVYFLQLQSAEGGLSVLKVIAG